MKSYTLNAIFFLFLACSWADSATVRPKGFFSRNSTTITAETPNSEKVIEARNTISTTTGLPNTATIATTSSTSTLSTTTAPLASTTRRRIPNIFNVARNTTFPRNRTRIVRQIVRNSTITTIETPKLSEKAPEARNTITTTTALPNTNTTTRRRIPHIFNVARNTTTPRNRTRIARHVADMKDEDKSDEDDKIHEENHSDAPADRKTLDPKSLILNSPKDSEVRANPTVVPVVPALSKASGAPVDPEVSKTVPVAHDEKTVRKPTLTLPKAVNISVLPLAPKDAKTVEEPHLPIPQASDKSTSHSITKRSLTTLIPLMSSLGAPAALALLAQAFFAPFIALLLGLLGGIGSSWWMGQLPGLDRFNPFTFPSSDPPPSDNEISSRSSRGFDFNARNVMSAIESGYKMWQNIQKNQL